MEGYDNYRYRAIVRKQDLTRFLTNRSNVIGEFIIYGSWYIGRIKFLFFFLQYNIEYFDDRIFNLSKGLISTSHGSTLLL